MIRELAALRHHLGDLEWKARTLPGYGQAVIQRQMLKVKDKIVDLERSMAAALPKLAPAARAAGPAQ